MNHDLQLNDMPFNAIKSGKKKIETRTKTPPLMRNYEEWKAGDTITFTNSANNEVMKVEILGVRHYKDIPDLLDAEGQENVMSYDTTREEAIVSWDKLQGYTEGIKKYGI